MKLTGIASANAAERFSPKNFLLLTAAGVINAFGVTLFLMPANIYDSGISGTSMLLGQLTPEWMALSYFLLILNIPVFLFGAARQGKVFTLYAVYSVFIYSLAAWIINNVIFTGAVVISPFAGGDLFLCALFGGLISGVGSGLAIRFGGAMDGIEVLAVIFAKRAGITVGTFVMIYNVILYIACGIAMQSWVLPLYSIVAYAAALKTVDFLVEGFDRSKSAMIITDKPDGVCRALSEAFETGMTLIPAKGFYSDSEKTAVYFIVNRFQVGRMKAIVHRVDPRAYISITEVANVFGSNAG